MKVVFISRSTLYSTRVGDTTQVEQTAKHLRLLGIHVDIKLTTDNIEYEKYDLLHFFNLIRPNDILHHLQKTNKPIIVSPIYVDYSDFDQHDRQGMTRLMARAFGKHGSEYLKTVFRSLIGQDSSTSFTYLLGHKRAIKAILKRTSMLLPNSKSEAGRIENDFGNKLAYLVIPNAIDTELFHTKDGVDRNKKQVICVAQIEGRKNQHRLIDATKDLDVDLVLIGRPSPNNRSYFDYCKKMAHLRVRFIDFLVHDELTGWYNRSAVHVLPSWFETTGLTSLEAAACGCKLVVSDNGDTDEYFSGGAEFCRANSTESIKSAIERALESDYRSVLHQRIKDEFNWANTAKKTLDAYKEVLS
jgi:glycosyltransferase involved in cell wall biosynthesis